MGAGLSFPERALLLPNVHGIVDDFAAKDTNIWTTTATDSGTAAVGDAVGGVLQLLPSDGTVADNDEVYVQSKELFKVANALPLYFAARVQFAEAATNAANVMFGFMDAPIANALVDDGAGPKTTFSGAVFHKRDGETQWRCTYSDGAVQSESGLLSATNTLNKIAQTAGGSSYALFEIEIRPFTSTRCEVVYKINGVPVYTFKERTYANATEMAAMIGAKNGSANQETINCDWIVALQAR